MAKTIQHVSDLEDLTEAQLRWYIMEFKHRAGTWHRQKSGGKPAAQRPSHSRRRQYANVEEPF